MTKENKGGRPTKYTKELGKQICSLIARGESIRKLVKKKEMPSAASIFNWLLDEDKKEFLEQYEQARNIQAELMFDEILEIADQKDVQRTIRDRLRVDTRKWYLSKVLPKKFGDKLDLTTLGKELPKPILGNVIPTDSSSKQDSETKAED